MKYQITYIEEHSAELKKKDCKNIFHLWLSAIWIIVKGDRIEGWMKL